MSSDARFPGGLVERLPDVLPAERALDVNRAATAAVPFRPVGAMRAMSAENSKQGSRKSLPPKPPY